VVALADEGQAGSEHHVGKLHAAGDTQAAVVEESAAAAFGGIELVHDRIVDHPGDDLPWRSSAMELAKMGIPWRKFVVPSRGHMPAVLAVRALDLAALLHHQPKGRAGFGQFGADDLLRLAVGGGNEISRTFPGNLEVFHFAEIANKASACLGRGLNHYVEEGGAGHFLFCHLLFRRARCPARRSAD
jgi:hypothetical protein